ncbi:MAG: 6-carboxytetrahydropterin synthase [Gemmatimonadota bacterium]|jgi:6-pyruvoyltetrahydropterin/6-carboxytetrahydropterin synthase|nr:6-carboxytetrahydropterin synthase [Gemmatimonadota bacterium]
MPTVRITRRLHFSAAHRLHSDQLSAEENASFYGLCNSPNYHGHNYELDVTVEGEIDPDTGYVMDLGRLKALVEAEVVADVDHRNLNLDVPWLEGVIPSAENLVVRIWERLAGRIRDGRLVKLVLWETPRNYAEYQGDIRGNNGGEP